MTDFMDDDFVVHGSKTPLWEKPGYLSNSELTLTSRRLSQNTLFRPGNQRSLRRSYDHGYTNTMTRNDVDAASDEMNMKKSVTFNQYYSANGSENSASSSDPFMNGNMNGDVSSNNGSEYSSGSIGMSLKPHQMVEWYTQPIHRRKEVFGISNGISNGLQKSDIVQPGAVDAGFLQELVNQNSGKDIRPRASIPSIDALAREFFPNTLGAAYTLQSIDNSKVKTESPPAKGLPSPNSTPWKPKRSKSPSVKTRPGSAHSSTSSASRSSIDKMYLMSAETPKIGSSTVLLSSPYQSELASLRMDRLRIEEERLLEVKRQDELERIRGPTPKWYEMKTPRFHYESKKNTELLKNEKDWQSLMDYRIELEKACKDYSKTHSYHST